MAWWTDEQNTHKGEGFTSDFAWNKHWKWCSFLYGYYLQRALLVTLYATSIGSGALFYMTARGGTRLGPPSSTPELGTWYPADLPMSLPPSIDQPDPSACEPSALRPTWLWALHLPTYLQALSAYLWVALWVSNRLLSFIARSVRLHDVLRLHATLHLCLCPMHCPLPMSFALCDALRTTLHLHVALCLCPLPCCLPPTTCHSDACLPLSYAQCSTLIRLLVNFLTYNIFLIACETWKIICQIFICLYACGFILIV